MKFPPYQKCVWGGGGEGKVLAMVKGGGEGKGFRVVFPQKLDVLAILKGGGGGCKNFPPLKMGDATFLYPVLRGGGGAQKVSDLRFSHFVAPTPHSP